MRTSLKFWVLIQMVAAVLAVTASCGRLTSDETSIIADETSSGDGSKLLVTSYADNDHDFEMSFKSLLENASDSDLVNKTFEKISDRYDHWVDASQYTPEERVVMLVWHSNALIGNGGFEFLFSDNYDGDPDYRITAEAYRTAGITRRNEAFMDAFRLFPDGSVPHNAELRIEQYQKADPAVRDAINTKCFQDMWDHVIEKKLAEYIRSHAKDLNHLDEAAKSQAE